MESTPQYRLSSALRKIAYLTLDIDHHDLKAHELRKIREKYKGQRDRAQAAIERELAFNRYHNKI